MRYVVERCALIEFPAPIAMAVGGMNSQHRRQEKVAGVFIQAVVLLFMSRSCGPPALSSTLRLAMTIALR